MQQQKEKMLLDRLNKSFRKAENQLKAVLEWRKAEVKVSRNTGQGRARVEESRDQGE